MTSVTITGISKSYQAGVPVLKPIDLTIQAGELFFLLGPSGCGKSTLLRILAGLVEPDGGSIRFNGREITRLPAEKRRAAMVFQNYALWPHLTVFENVAFGLRAEGADNAKIRKEVADALELVQLADCAERKIPSLSGGQQQRVALARTLTQSPSIILADEPVAALDPVTAKQVMQDFVRINQEMGISILLNIHHVELALEYADRIIGIRAGKIVYDGPSDKVDQAVLDSIYGEDTGTEASV